LIGRARDLAIIPLLALSAFLQFYGSDSQQLFLGDQALHGKRQVSDRTGATGGVGLGETSGQGA